MDKLTVFFIVFLYACLRGLMQRRHVREELERRMEAARSRSKPHFKTETTPAQTIATIQNDKGDEHGQID